MFSERRSDQNLPLAPSDSYALLLETHNQMVELKLRSVENPRLGISFTLEPERKCLKYGCSCMDLLISYYQVTREGAWRNFWFEKGRFTKAGIHITDDNRLAEFRWYHPHDWEDKPAPTLEELLEMVRISPLEEHNDYHLAHTPPIEWILPENVIRFFTHLTP